MTLSLNNQNFVDILQSRSKYQPNKLAVTYLADGEQITESLTYALLDNAAKKIAIKLQSLDLQNQQALLLYESGAEFIKSFFGCLYAGVIAVPTYIPKSKHLLQKTEKIARDCDAKIILSTPDILAEITPNFSPNSHLATLSCLATNLLNDEYLDQYELPHISSEKTAFIQYTSGSTSDPKGVVISHKNILVNELMLQNAFNLSEQTVGISWLPLFHDMGLIASLLSSIFVGYPVYIMPPSAFIRKPYRWLQLISKYQGTYTCAPNFAYDLCIRKTPEEIRASLNLSSLKTAVNAAEPILYRTIEAFSNMFSAQGFNKNAFTPGYGLAEATVCVSGKTGRELSFVRVDAAQLQLNKIVYSESIDGAQTLVNCGPTHYCNQQIKIVNSETKMECASHEVGEIWVTGDHISTGYFNKPELNIATFQATLIGNPHQHFLRTGDLGFINDAGDLFINGRIKDLIIINGHNYYPQDIEFTVETTHEVIRKNHIAAFAIEVQHTEQIVIVAEIQKNLAKNLNLKSIAAQINASLLALNELTAYEIIFIASGTIPKTTSGKIQRQACKSQYLNSQLEILEKWSSYSHAEDFIVKDQTITKSLPPEKLVLKTQIIDSMIIWLVKTLKTSLASVASNMHISSFNLDSIQKVELSNEIEKILQAPVSEKILYEDLTLEGIANFLIENLTVQATIEGNSLINTKVINNACNERKIAIPKFTARLPA